MEVESFGIEAENREMPKFETVVFLENLSKVNKRQTLKIQTENLFTTNKFKYKFPSSKIDLYLLSHYL